MAIIEEKRGDSTFNRGEVAPFILRAVNFFADIFLFSISMIIFFTTISLVNSQVAESLEHLTRFNISIIWGMAYFLYYFSFETIFQKTPAKFLTKTKVFMQDGTKPHARDIFYRTLSRLPGFEIFTISKKSYGWTWGHDRWSCTLVFKVYQD